MASEEWTSPGWAYADDEWQAILSVAPEADSLRYSLESAANDLLKLPTSAEVRGEMTAEYDFQQRLSKATAALLSVLEEIEERKNLRLIDILTDVLHSSEQVMEELSRGIPHSNKLNGWGEYLWYLCQVGHRELGLPITQRRGSDNFAYGPLVDFLVAVAGPVKIKKGPYNLSGPMTAEKAHRAIRGYAQSVDDEADERVRAMIIAAVMAEDQP